MSGSEGFGPSEFQDSSGAGAEAMADMLRFRELLADWNTRMNLVGPAALGEFWRRHAWDSAQLLAFAPGVRVWADLGAGAGFPGLVLAILLKSVPAARVHLVESQAKRCRFLEAVATELQLPATIHNLRAEDAAIADVEVVTARACAPMIRLLAFAEPFFKRGATGLFLKGKEAAAEVSEARARWRFKADLSASLSGSDGHVVRVEKLSRA